MTFKEANNIHKLLEKKKQAESRVLHKAESRVFHNTGGELTFIEAVKEYKVIVQQLNELLK